MKVAVISDIHGNYAALSSVFTDMEDIDAIACCGDIVGYGPKPRKCTSLIMNKVDWAVKGNHESMLLSNDTFNSRDAREGIKHSKKRLYRKHFSWIESLDNIVKGYFSGISFVLTHSGKTNPNSNHLYKDDILQLIDSCNTPEIFLYGHTHVPFVENSDDTLVVNPGSVGQPRDGDSRASYAIIDTNKRDARIYRVCYPTDETAEQIDNLGLPEGSRNRLYRGI